MSAIDPAKIFTGSSLTTEPNSNLSSVDNSISQVTDELSTLGGNFGDLFINAQSLEGNVSDLSSEGETNVGDEPSSSNLLSSIGFSLLATGTESAVGELSSQIGSLSLESMQNNLLSILQTNVFNINKLTDEVVDVGQSTQSLITTTIDTAQEVSLPELPIDEISLASSVVQYSFGENGLDLNDAFDSLNVLQHIPVVSSVYQDVSGQEISAVSKLTGGYLYGGVVGLAFSAVDLAIESYSGATIGDSLINFNYGEFFSSLSSNSNNDNIMLNSDNARNITGNESSFINVFRDKIVYESEQSVAK